MANRNQKLVPGANRALEQLKYEIASEFGVELSGNTSARLNGSVGGEIVKRMIVLAEQSISGQRSL